VRLQKFLAQGGVASRRRAEELITGGKVRVNGELVTALGTQVGARDRVDIEGRRIRAETPVYRVLLKPRQCLATLARAEKGRSTLARFIPDVESGWKVVAPLDYPAEGVVLLTTDGALAEKMSRGGGRIAMTYHLKMQGAVNADALAQLRKGWKFEGRPVKPSAVEALATSGRNTWIEVTVPESRPRVLKAAGEYIRHSLLKISRVRLGPVSFEGLKMGGWRDLTKGEINALRRGAGLTAEED